MSAAMEKGDWWNQGLLAALGFKGADPGMAWDEPELGKPGNMSVGAGSVLLLQLFSRNLSNCPKPPVHAFMMSKRGSGSTRSLMSITSQRHRRGLQATRRKHEYTSNWRSQASCSIVATVASDKHFGLYDRRRPEISWPPPESQRIGRGNQSLRSVQPVVWLASGRWEHTTPPPVVKFARFRAVQKRYNRPPPPVSDLATLLRKRQS